MWCGARDLARSEPSELKDMLVDIFLNEGKFFLK